jgi:adenine-specific DNA-methyltransferase
MGRRKAHPITNAAPVASYKHPNKRMRIPTQEESVKLSARDKQPVKKRYDYDPSLDPQLIWTGKKESRSEFTISTVPIYVQEQIAPEALISRLKSGTQTELQYTLFEETAQEQFYKAIEFYKHEGNWQNRMILGDSLLIMNSLLEKEGMRGKVQCVYIDPPYGIRFGSNWQTSTKTRSVKDNKIDDFIRQPEQIKAFRDTWELGIHSYLSYLRDRLITVRELLAESGSVFIQISDDNVHLIRCLLDEVFGCNNFINEICFTKTAGGLETKKSLAGRFDYIIWYAKDSRQIKYRQLYEQRPDDVDAGYNQLMLPNGETRPLTKEEKSNLSSIPKGARLFRSDSLTKPGPGSKYEIELNRKKYDSGNRWWGSPKESILKLIKMGRVKPFGNTLRYIKYLDDFPYKPINNLWTGYVGAKEPIYVVQTNEAIITRCILLTSDPGDLVIDPTCGSGTTAYVAEQWGRRWITIDTSRVALALARTRLMTAKYPYYKLKEKDVLISGFDCKTVPHVTLTSLANNEEPDQEILYDQPSEEKNIVRVTGPFAVESLSPHRVSDAQEMLSSERFVETIVSNLLKAGVQTGEKDARVEFANLDILPGGPEIQASGEYKTESGLKKVAVAIGPEFGSIDDDFILDAIRVAKRFAYLLVIAATSFDASAASISGTVEGLQIMKVKINPDLSMGDLLKKTGSGNLFLAFGEPDIKVKETKKGVIVEVVGVDVYDPVKAEIRSSGSGDPENDIAAWFIDTNYNGSAFFVTHAYFLGADKPYEKLKKALKADIHEDVWNELYSTESRPFSKPKSGKIAIKVINHYGDEVMKVVEIK